MTRLTHGRPTGPWLHSDRDREVSVPPRTHRQIRRLAIDQGFFRHKIGWQGKRLAGELQVSIRAIGCQLRSQAVRDAPAVSSRSARNLWPLLWGGGGECAPALLEEAGRNLADQDKGHRGEHGNRMKATGEAQG